MGPSIRMQPSSNTSTLYATILYTYVILELQQRKIVNDSVFVKDSAVQNVAAYVRKVLQEHMPAVIYHLPELCISCP